MFGSYFGRNTSRSHGLGQKYSLACYKSAGLFAHRKCLFLCVPGFGHLAEVVSDQTDCNLCFSFVWPTSWSLLLFLPFAWPTQWSLQPVTCYSCFSWCHPSSFLHSSLLTLLRVSCELEILVAKLLVVELQSIYIYTHIAKPCERAGYTSWVAGCPDQPLDLYTRCPTMCECSDYNIPV